MIVFENEEMIVLNKPTGLDSQQGGDDESLDQLIEKYC